MKGVKLPRPLNYTFYASKIILWGTTGPEIHWFWMTHCYISDGDKSSLSRAFYLKRYLDYISRLITDSLQPLRDRVTDGKIY